MRSSRRSHYVQVARRRSATGSARPAFCGSVSTAMARRSSAVGARAPPVSPRQSTTASRAGGLQRVELVGQCNTVDLEFAAGAACRAVALSGKARSNSRCAARAARRCARQGLRGGTCPTARATRRRAASDRGRCRAPTGRGSACSRSLGAGECIHALRHAGSVNVGSVGSVTSRSRSQPSFSSLMCWIATALALASRSGSAWNSDTQQRNTL